MSQEHPADPVLLGDAPTAVPAEGSLLPESYSFERGEKRVAVMLRMQKAMQDFLAEAWAKRQPGSVVSTDAVT